MQRALERDAQSRERRARQAQFAERLAALTEREREVMRRVIEGKPNKVIAEELDISVRTVEFHRANVMEKMGAGSVAALIQLMARRAGAGRIAARPGEMAERLKAHAWKACVR